MNSLTKNDMYHGHDYPSSPSRRTAPYNTQSLNRQNSRGFDPYAQQNGLYSLDEATQAYDVPRFNDRMTPGMQSNYNAFDTGMPQAWNASGFGQNNNLAAPGATGRRPSARQGRSQLPSSWLDANQQYGYGGPQVSFGGLPPMRHDSTADDEELIPTAIVIKNIPFAVKKEQLVDIMTHLGLPLPYAFNYHFDNGVFRGLAFANFTTAEETQAVIQHMNNMNLEGRKLRVEYKKMLPQAERDRIEREKRERRGQLEEQHRPLGGSQLQPSTSLSSIGGGLQARTPSPGNAMNPHGFDMNDPLTLEYYTKLLMFQSDRSGTETMDFPPQLPPEHRKIIHGLAHMIGLSHQSEGQGEQRFIRIGRGITSYEAMRRGLHRSATTDFSQSRNDGSYGPTRDAPAFLGMDPHASLSTSALRAAKSHADLRSFTSSPAQSAASFPANVANSISRYDSYNYGQDSPGSSRPNLTPTSVMPSSDEFLANGLGSLNLGSNQYTQQTQGSPQRLRAIASWDRQAPAPGPIGGHRAFSANQEDSNRSRPTVAPTRQPRGPTTGQGSGFIRGAGRGGHRSRGSDERSSPNGAESLGE